MGFRLIEVYSNPRQIVKEAFSFPNLKLGLSLVLAYAVLSSVFLMALFPKGFSALSAIGLIALELLNWLVFGLLLAFFAVLWHGRRHSKGKLGGALTALSFRNLVCLVAVFFMLLVPLVAFPGMEKDMNDLTSGKISVTSFEEKIGQNINIFSAIVLLVVFVAVAASVFFYLYLTYLAVWNSLETTVFKTIVMTIVIMLISGLISSILSYFLVLF